MISDNHNISLGVVDCSFYNHRFAPKDDNHNKKLEMLAYTLLDYNFLETLAKTCFTPVKENKFSQEDIFSNAPVRRTTIAMKLTSAFTVSYTTIHSDNRNSISDKLENSKKVNQWKSSILQIIVAFVSKH